MNHVTIGHFVCDENGHSKGGKPGDQTGREGRFQAWYKNGSNGKATGIFYHTKIPETIDFIYVYIIHYFFKKSKTFLHFLSIFPK